MGTDRHTRSGRLAAAGMRGFGRLHVALYRRSGGRIGRRTKKVPVLLLTTTGRRTGEARTVPLVHYRDGDDIILSASNAGNWLPAWFLNVEAEPQVTVELGDQRFDAVAEIAGEDERPALWDGMVAQNPAFADYAVRAGRIIPMVRLRRVAS